MKTVIFWQIPGGADSWDLMLPLDTASYSALADLRATLFAQYDTAGFPRDAETLEDTELFPNNTGPDALDAGRRWAMSPQLSGLADLFNDGDMTIVSDVGPLMKPVTKSEVLSATRGVDIPGRLFSHNDQQAWMESLATDGASATGIGGLIADLLAEKLTLSAGHRIFDRISFGSSLFTTAQLNTAFKLTSNGASAQLGWTGQGPLSVAWNSPHNPDHLDYWRSDDWYEPRGLLEQSLNQMRNGLYLNGTIFNTWMDETPPEPNTAYVPSASGLGSLSNIHNAIMKMIVRGASTTPVTGGLSHQIIHVRASPGSVDSHSNQATTVPAYQLVMDEFLTTLYEDIVDVGAADDVLIVVGSEFNRTITPNSSGTDHAWGGAGLVFFIGGENVLGGQGGKIVGGTPASPDFDPTDPDDLGTPRIYNSRGYVIPQNSIEQVFANIGYFLGLTAAEMANGIGEVPPVFPLLSEFIPPGGSTVADAVLPIIAAPGS